jgi:hypothetical protein
MLYREIQLEDLKDLAKTRQLSICFQNEGGDLIDFNESVTKEGNLFSVDPLLDMTSFMPAADSPCVNGGKLKYELNGKTILEIAAKYFTGSAPDLGAVERK